MYYSKFYIKNYKGIKELTLDLNIRPKVSIYTLVGLNESGKTTILEALNLFRKDIPKEKRYKLIPKSRSHNFNDEIVVQATIGLEECDIAEIKDLLVKTSFKSTEIPNMLIITKKYIFENSNPKDIKTNWIFPIIGKLKNSRKEITIGINDEIFKPISEYLKSSFPPILYYENFLFEFPKRIYLEDSPKFSGNQKLKNQLYRDILQDVLDSLNEDSNSLHEKNTLDDQLLNRVKNPENTDSDKAALRATLRKMGSKISHVVFKAWEDLFDSTGKEINVEIELDNENNCYFLELTLNEGSETYEIADRSLGFKWFFTFLLFTEFRKNRTKDKGEILFLLDEPASNLHSTAQTKLLKKFEALVQAAPSSNPCKLIYTTHSHHLIEPRWLSGAYVIRNKALDPESEFQYDALKTDIDATLYKKFASQYPDQQKYFKPILDCLDYQPGLLEEVPFIIITEGKTDYYILRYINEIVLENKYPDLKFYPGGGAGQHDQTIRLYLGWQRDFTILLDGDQAGLKEEERYEKEFGLIIKDKIITLQKVNPHWNFSIENLFNSNDQVQVTQYFKPTLDNFDKSAFNSSIQELLVQKQIISLSDETIANFEKLYKFLNVPFPIEKALITSLNT